MVRLSSSVGVRSRWIAATSFVRRQKYSARISSASRFVFVRRNAFRSAGRLRLIVVMLRHDVRLGSGIASILFDSAFSDYFCVTVFVVRGSLGDWEYANWLRVDAVEGMKAGKAHQMLVVRLAGLVVAEFVLEAQGVFAAQAKQDEGRDGAEDRGTYLLLGLANHLVGGREPKRE